VRDDAARPGVLAAVAAGTPGGTHPLPAIRCKSPGTPSPEPIKLQSPGTPSP